MTREEQEQIAEIGPGRSTLWVPENPKCLCGNSHRGGKEPVTSLTNIAIVVVVAINLINQIVRSGLPTAEQGEPGGAVL